MTNEWYQQKKLEEMRNQSKALLDIRDVLVTMASLKITEIEFSGKVTYEVRKGINDVYRELTNGINERWSE